MTKNLKDRWLKKMKKRIAPNVDMNDSCPQCKAKFIGPGHQCKEPKEMAKACEIQEKEKQND